MLCTERLAISKSSIKVGFEVLMAVNMKNTVFWDEAECVLL
jgi:hypothetical protein